MDIQRDPSIDTIRFDSYPGFIIQSEVLYIMKSRHP